MARIKLDLPEHLPFVTRFPIRITDLNYAGHLSNDKVLAMAHEARFQFFKHHGYTELAAEGIAFIMGDCAIVYKAEGFHGQMVKVSVGAGDYTNYSVDLLYRMELEEDGKVMAEVKTGLVAYSYEKQKVRRIPTALKEKFGDVTAVV